MSKLKFTLLEILSISYLIISLLYNAFLFRTIEPVVSVTFLVFIACVIVYAVFGNKIGLRSRREASFIISLSLLFFAIKSYLILDSPLISMGGTVAFLHSAVSYIILSVKTERVHLFNEAEHNR